MNAVIIQYLNSVLLNASTVQETSKESVVLLTVISLVALGALAAIILYFVAQKFNVVEDPRIDLVEEALPAANCGGCGFPGCRAFAEALVKSDDISDLNCPVGGADVMGEAATILGKEVAKAAPLIAVVRCNGTCDNRPKTNNYDGAMSCAVASALYGGDTGCSFGCLGCGDCVKACDFDAIYMDEETGLPVVKDNCVACGACVKACPKNIIELRNVGPKGRRIFVSCVNEDKGGVAKKACSAACIGCKKCFKECKFDAITVENNLAFIDHQKCKLCRKCVSVCPTAAIHEINFPPKKERAEKPKVAKVVKEKVAVDATKPNSETKSADTATKTDKTVEVVAKPSESTEAKPASSETKSPKEPKADVASKEASAKEEIKESKDKPNNKEE